MMKIVEELFDGPVDVVGDVHGQLEALDDLIEVLGYASDGAHADGRRLVFVGDLVDRGPDSVGVIGRVMKMVKAGNAQCVLGNHELNLLRNAPKLDNGWYFSQEEQSVNGQQVATDEEREEIREFLGDLPLALERDDLRVVHACWSADAIERLTHEANDQSDAASEYDRYRGQADEMLETNGLLTLFETEKAEYGALIEYGGNNPYEHWPDAKILPGHATVNEARQMGNPVAVLTSGQERAAGETYSAGGKYRFVNRVAWWDEYVDERAVIVGHYWRLYDFNMASRPRAVGIDVFKGTRANQWLGARDNVYCVDFSAGGRGARFGKETCRLAAVRWPEATVMFDNGEALVTDHGVERG